MRTLALSLAALSLAALVWQFGPSYDGQWRAMDQNTAAPIDRDALNAQARGALQRLREKQNAPRFSALDHNKIASLLR